MTNRTLTVDPAHEHTVFGPRHRAESHFREHGIALWVRANGRATVFFRDRETGRRRRKTWAKVASKR